MPEFPFLSPDRTFVIAEIGVNHNGDPDLARQLIDIAKSADADAVKFQTFKASALASKMAKKAKYQNENDPKAESQLEMLTRLELQLSDLKALADYTRAAGLEFMSTPFDEDSAQTLFDIGVRAFKISSGDLTALQFLKFVSEFKRPMILSTGMGNLTEVSEAVDTIRQAGNPPLALLHCVSNYPASPQSANLRAIDTLNAAFGVPVGWSDHTLGETVAVAAVARGARIVEKHYTLDKGLPGPDHKASLTPKELESYIQAIRTVEVALGDGVKRPHDSEIDTIAAARRSVVLAQDMKAGDVLTPETLIVQRPGYGISPKFLDLVLGRRVTRDMETGHVLDWSDLA